MPKRKAELNLHPKWSIVAEDPPDARKQEAFIGINELVQRTGLSAQWWYRMTNPNTQDVDSVPPHYKIGKMLKFKWSEIEGWIEAHKRQ